MNNKIKAYRDYSAGNLLTNMSNIFKAYWEPALLYEQQKMSI